MNDSGPYAQGGFDDRGDGRDRRDDYHYGNAQPQATSPPTSASPFAFAPPPLSSIPGPGSRPSMPMHHSDPAPGQGGGYSYYSGTKQQQQQQQQQPGASGGGAYTYSSHPMGGYRSTSSDTQRSTPQPPPPLTRAPSISLASQAGGGMPSPTTGSPYGGYPPPRAPGQQYGGPMHSPRGSNIYPQNYYATPYAQPQAVDMPRSLSYPSNYPPPYGAYLPSMSAPALVAHPNDGSLPPLARHGSSNSIGIGMDMGRQPPNLGYSFAHRLPLVDRPFKCDECVQSFNRNHDLKRHKRIHLSVKPFGCDKCGKTFSRKDALRRHWLVKGCRGEDGATAPITPTFPLNQPPALSPPTPPTNVSPTDGASLSHGYASSTLSYSHPAAPPPLTSLPARQPSDQPSQIIVTPDELAAQQRAQAHGLSGRGSLAGPVSGGGGHGHGHGHLVEPLVIDPALSGLDGSAPSGRGSSGSLGDGGDGYFEMVPKDHDGASYSRYASSPSNDIHHHPYRRPSHHISSPSKHSPPQGYMPTPTTVGADGKPIFAMPFNPSSQGLLAPPGGEEMSKEGSADSVDQASWQRWHRPSFPFPTPNNYANTAVDVNGSAGQYAA